MKNLLFVLFIFCLVASPTFAVTRTLSCENHSDKIEFGICGVIGCPATITVNGTPTTYNFSRQKLNTGALVYKTARGKRPKCNITITPLHRGVRQIESCTCASALKNANCQISQ